MAGRFRTTARCDTLELAKTSSQMYLERQPVPPCVEPPRTWKWKESMALKKKIAAKRQAWNKGLEVGKKDAFTPAQVKRIRGVLANRGDSGLRDLTFFSMAVDTMLRGPDLVALTVRDVQLPNGTIRSVIKIAPSRRRPPVRCAVSEKTATTLGKWIAESGIKGTDYIFPGQRGGHPRPMSSRQMARRLKSWVAEAGFDPKQYGLESLRRTKALHILNSTGDLETVRVLLGHEKIESTSHYLSIAKRTKSDFIAISRTFDI
jgi:integrase